MLQNLGCAQYKCHCQYEFSQLSCLFDVIEQKISRGFLRNQLKYRKIMVVGAFPAAKLGVLAFKQLSKPVANLIKERAKSSPFFRQYICMPPAQCKCFMRVCCRLHNCIILMKPPQQYFNMLLLITLYLLVYNWVEVQTKMWAMNMGKPTNVPQLNETMAIDLGANLLGEVIIFSIGAGLLIFEYVR